MLSKPMKVLNWLRIWYYPYFNPVNYLGHLVLSGQDDEVLLGNFMADAVKGSSYKMYPQEFKRHFITSKN